MGREIGIFFGRVGWGLGVLLEGFMKRVGGRWGWVIFLFNFYLIGFLLWCFVVFVFFGVGGYVGRGFGLRYFVFFFVL